MPKSSIFIAVLESLLFLAPKPTSDPLSAFSVSATPHDVVLRLWPMAQPRDLVLDYGVAGLGLSAIPSKFIPEGRREWSEVG